MDIAGRRPLLLFPMLAMILDLALMTVCLILQVTPLTVSATHSSLARLVTAEIIRSSNADMTRIDFNQFASPNRMDTFQFGTNGSYRLSGISKDLR